MIYQVQIKVMPLKDLLDPQGKAVTQSMGNLGLKEITNVRIGKHITLKLDAADEASAKSKVDEACKKLLVNMTVESFEFTITKI